MTVILSVVSFVFPMPELRMGREHFRHVHCVLERRAATLASTIAQFLANWPGGQVLDSNDGNAGPSGGCVSARPWSPTWPRDHVLCRQFWMRVGRAKSPW